LARQQLTIGLHVLLRPRGGDFYYTDLEFAVMKRDLEIIKATGCDGIVLGILQTDGTVDMERTAELIAAARPLTVTFHRAFDMTPDPMTALRQLIHLQVDRLLTSGQERTALEGSELIAVLIEKAAGNLIIMPGGGITERNIARLIRETGAQEFHLSGRKKIPSAMQYHNHRVTMGGALHLPEYEYAIADAHRINQVAAAAAAAYNH
jgi:copper homeostasis protein